MTHTEQIPTWGFINFHILYQIEEARKNGQLTRVSIAEIIDNTCNYIGSNIPLLNFYSPINAGTIFSLLYSLLVVPKELFAGNRDLFIDFQVDTSNFFRIDKGEGLLVDNWQLFRVLRNAVSHANFKIDKLNNFDVELWNTNRNGEKDVILKSDINRLGNFANEFAKYLIKKQNGL